jgi:predicted nucleic acid-binding Zn ribbon protein
MLVILKFLLIQFASSHSDHITSKGVDIIKFSNKSNTPQILSHYHCIHTQIVIAYDGAICDVECGFLGHQKNAQQFVLMRQIGINLPFPDDLYLLGIQYIIIVIQ